MKSNGARSSYSKYGSYYRNTDNAYGRYKNSSHSYSPRYNYTSEAFDLIHEAPIPYRKNKRSKRGNVVYKRVREAAPLSLLKTYSTIAVIFCFVLALLCMYASNSGLKTEISELQDRLVATQEDNEYTRIAIEDNIDLNRIQQEAMKLGLQTPAEYQIMEINVPKDSYTVQYESEEADTEKGFWSLITNLFKD